MTIEAKAIDLAAFSKKLLVVELDILRHTVGASKGFSRNYFCTGDKSKDFTTCENLVSMGLMVRRKSQFSSDFIYHCTDAGIALVKRYA